MTNRNLCVLIIDDNSDNVLINKTYVLDSYPTALVYTSNNGRDGILLARQVNPDVLLLDVNMPEMDGFEVCRRVKSDPRIQDIPVIFLTALKSDKDTRMKALEVGGDAFLSKPVDLFELKAQIKAMWRIKVANNDKRIENQRLAQLVKEKTELLSQTNQNLLIENERRKNSEINLELARNKFRSVLNDAPALICEYNPKGQLTYANQSYFSIYKLDENLNDGFEEMPYSELCRIKETWEKSLSLTKELPSQTYIECILRNGLEIWIEWRDRIVLGQNNKIVSFYSVGVDISETIKSDKVIQSLLNQREAMFSEHNAVMLLIDPQTKTIIDCNPAASRFYGYEKEALIDQKASMICDETDWLYTDLDSEKHRTVQHKLKDGSIRTVDIYSSEINYDGQLVFYAIIVDVTDREEAINEIRFISYHDHLTGLYNRRFFEEEMKRLDVNRNLPITIVMGDVNGLKLINDSFGHLAGDDILKATADLLKSGCRADEIIARIGGDEYAILLPMTSEAEAQVILSRIKIQSRVLQKEKPLLSVSFGFSTKTDESESLKDCLVKAENIMYSHKMYDSASMRSKSVTLIMNALFEKSQREMRHSQRVSDLCARLASELNFEQDAVNKISTAGLVHDIGKIGVDEKILNKPDRLTEQEWIEIKKHPASGWRILNGIAEFTEVSIFVLHHHENWNGSGYPSQLRGLDIPVESRIIAIADAYDAMTSVRSYRKGLTKDEVVLELMRHAGSQFDPILVDLFIGNVIPTLN